MHHSAPCNPSDTSGLSIHSLSSLKMLCKHKAKFILFVFVVFSTSCLCAQAIDTVYIKDTTMTVSECYFFDQGGYKNGYPGGAKTITFISASGQRLGVHIDSLHFNYDNDVLYAYDGTSSGAPLLSAMNNQSGRRAVKSTGNALTFVFYAWGYGTDLSIYGFGGHLQTLSDPVESGFATVYNGFFSNNFDLKDYDKDGDLDILSGGGVFRNDSRKDSMYFFEKKLTTPLGNWRTCSMGSADFDGDGKTDVFVMGQNSTVYYHASAKLYLNNGNETFRISPQNFLQAYEGRVKIFDYNHDGKPDISYIGQIDVLWYYYTLKLYINNGDGTFTDKTINVPGYDLSCLDWADTDNDGDYDLVVNGKDVNRVYAKFYVNDNDVFTEKVIGLAGSCSGEIRFVDINKDGKPDIINTGSNSPGGITPINTQTFINDGNNNFSVLVNNLPPLRNTYMDWVDYDGDNDPDLLMSGTNSLIPAVYIYKNNGSGNFTQIPIANIESYNPVKWVDVNNDHKPDALVITRGGYSYIAKNYGSDSFAIATLPFPAVKDKGGVVVDDFNNDGIMDIIIAGSLIDYDCSSYENSVFIKGAGWLFMPVPKISLVANINQDPGGIGYPEPMWKWGDFDNDGLVDILVTNDPNAPETAGGPVKAFKNYGNNVFKLVFDGLPGNCGYAHSIAVLDIDNDGKNELIVSPGCVYRWNGSFFALVSNSVPYCCTTMFMDFGDYNKDGYQDMVLSIGDRIRIFKNDKTGKFIELDPDHNDFPTVKYVKWVDLDNDGDLDIINGSGAIENFGNDRFVWKDTWIEPYSIGTVGNFNGDAYPDFYALTLRPYILPTNLYYGEGNNFFFKDITPAGFPQTQSANYDYVRYTTSFDIDNDGDDDILHSTGFCTNGLILNNNNLKKQNIHLQSPNGHEILYKGNSYQIQWNGFRLGNSMKILFSSNNGKTYSLITANAPSGSTGGSFIWSLSNIATSDSCRVKIVDNQNNMTADSSDQVFKISTALARDIISFTATRLNNTAGLLSWKTDVGTHVHSFEVYKSEDGINFKKIGLEHSSFDIKAYSFIDSNLVPGNNFYYLKSIHSDGGYSISEIKNIKIEQQTNLKISAAPNPFSGTTSIKIYSTSSFKSPVVIRDERGKIVYHSTWVINMGNNQFGLDLSYLNKGGYFVTIFDKNKAIQTIKIFKL